ncbi:DUF1525 domain-containing protein [Salinicola sp. JS01]|uniref:DUF1525 domain-containing protein n=1 Tax=Salinicola sp. JS01 TaxID=3050071 RepID=UPI0033422597
MVELDASARLDALISQDLPADPAQAKRVLQSRMSGLSTTGRLVGRRFLTLFSSP